jgi:hypothetical protein
MKFKLHGASRRRVLDAISAAAERNRLEKLGLRLWSAAFDHCRIVCVDV